MIFYYYPTSRIYYLAASFRAFASCDRARNICRCIVFCLYLRKCGLFFFGKKVEIIWTVLKDRPDVSDSLLQMKGISERIFLMLLALRSDFFAIHFSPSDHWLSHEIFVFTGLNFAYYGSFPEGRLSAEPRLNPSLMFLKILETGLSHGSSSPYGNTPAYFIILWKFFQRCVFTIKLTKNYIVLV